MTAEPFLSIGMPVRNGRTTIALAIASVRLQTYRNWELIVLDDGSTDGTPDVVRAIDDARIRLVADGKGEGIPRRRNQILDMARGPLFAWMDSDDVAYPRRFERQVAFLQQHPEVDLVAAEMIAFRGEGEIVGKRAMPVAHDEICRRPLSGFPLAQPTFTGRLEWFRRFGYDERVARGSDQDLLLRAYETSRYAGMKEVLVGYREEQVRLRKTLVGRWWFSRRALVESRRRGMLAAGVTAALAQGAKAAADIVAVVTGLNYRILRHRARPVTDAERSEWQAVWQQAKAAATTGR
ncbi:MAG TPA: glycosyltransferase [Thermoanaerobaculia bacterium]|jgi:glycosyltransferase involved in cell wall biosynthesis